MEETLAVESAAGETAFAQAPERKEEMLEEVLSRHRWFSLPLACCGLGD
jgi:OTU domain-containing protein 6